MKIGIITLIGLLTHLQAEPYTLGQGLHIDDSFNVGGYFSTEFQSKGSNKTVTLEDLAVLAYGDINPMFSYLGELEAPGFYSKNISNGYETRNLGFHIERLYADVWLNDAINFRLGKQITPIGYWNLEPINVLRDTTSDPLFATLLFPKFLTGIDINGYVPNMERMRYHLFGQENHDFDDAYINIKNTHFFGLALDKEISMEWNTGGALGEFISKTNNDRTRFLQGNVKFDNTQWGVMAEGIVAETEYTHSNNDYTISAYTQGTYHLNSQHAIVGRYEYYNNKHDNYTDNILTTGYSYRPLFPVSLKGEYQWHSQNDENLFLFSFSVLF
jgi:hypothetical protein